MASEFITQILETRNRNQDKIVIRNVLSLASLMVIQYFYEHEHFQVFMIWERLNRVSRFFKVVMPVSHAVDNSK